MRIDLRSFIRSEFTVALSTSSIATIVKMLAGLVISKIISIKIGPSGIALLGQFLNFSSLSSNLANASFGQGVTKYIADPDFADSKVLATSNIFTLFVSLTLSLIISLFANFLSFLLFDSDRYQYVFYVFAVMLPFFAINSLLISAVNGYREFRLLAVLKITNSIAALIIGGFLCWFFVFDGALISLSINTSIVFFISVFILYNSGKLFKLLSFDYKKFDRAILLKLLGFTLMALTSSQMKPLVFLYLRNYIINHSNILNAGIWEATKGLSDYYMMVVTSALASYYLPKLSSLKTDLLLKKEILYGIRLIMPIFIVIGSVVYFFRNFIIITLFSEQFQSMNSLILPQLIGDFFMVFSLLIAYIMLAKAMFKYFMITQLVFAFSRIIFSTFLFDSFGVIGMIWANALNYFLYSVTLVLIFRRILLTSSNL